MQRLEFDFTPGPLLNEVPGEVQTILRRIAG